MQQTTETTKLLPHNTAANAIDGMASILRDVVTRDIRGTLGACVIGDCMRDGAWIASKGNLGLPIYWVITKDATAIGHDPRWTVDYYRSETPSGIIAVYILSMGVWTRLSATDKGQY